MNRINLALLFLVTLFTSGLVNAQQNPKESVRSDKALKIGEKKKIMRERMHGYMLKRVDANGDGKIDLSEYLANAEQRFNNMDLDDDGYVTAQERKQAGKMMRAKHREMRKNMRNQHLEERAAQQEADGGNN